MAVQKRFACESKLETASKEVQKNFNTFCDKNSSSNYLSKNIYYISFTYMYYIYIKIEFDLS